MVSKSLIAYAFLLCFTTSVNAHSIVSPPLGVKKNPTRNDVQNPSTAKPCGNVDIAQSIDTSTAVAAAADGTFSPSITDFNDGTDGSRSIKTVQVDASGTGKNFVAAKMVVDGDANPTKVDTQQLTVQLPSGTKCTGGTGKNLCLASFITTAGFGNCVVVSQAQEANPSNSTTPGKDANKNADKNVDKNAGDVNTDTQTRMQTKTPPRILPRTQTRTPPRIQPRTQTRTPPRILPRMRTRTPPRILPRMRTRTPPRILPRTQTRTPPRLQPRMQLRTPPRMQTRTQTRMQTRMQTLFALPVLPQT
ncbi:hypothetical protein BJY52DRAFT_682882 [Lactarius psammicola]|nr:hypothetical protein BJY52DRAFT_682882 [Lactarius psammicola]